MADILWACHVRGPDDVHPAPDYETALKWADMFNEWGEQANASFKKKYTESDPADAPRIAAVPAPWPWDAKSWADGLAKSIADMTPRGPTEPSNENVREAP